MNDYQSGRIYTIILPDSTVDDVMLWFDLMESKGILTSSLIQIVYEYIKGTSPDVEIIDSKSRDHNESLYGISIESNGFFDSLYSCSESNSECFKENNANKKYKRKMLYI